MTTRKKVLVTGAAGLVGGVLRDGLADRYEISTIDVRPLQGDHLQASMADLDAVRPAFQGKDVVIDLASHAPSATPWDRVYANNVPCTFNALEAARSAGVGRLVFASSNHVTGMYENDSPYSDIIAGRYEGLEPSTIPLITSTMPVRPDGAYGIAKAFGEAAGRYYSDRFGLSVVCLRIGSLNGSGRPEGLRNFATLLTHSDAVRLFQACIDAPDAVRFAVFYGVSNNTWRFWDISDARSAIGYEPQDNAEKWR